MKRNVLAILAMLCVWGVAFQAMAQWPYVFNWNQNQNGNGATVLQTTTKTDNQSAFLALGSFTTYSVFAIINNSDVSVERQNIIPVGPGAATAYQAGPLSVQGDGTTANFFVWLNPNTAQNGSSESIYNIVINGIPIANTVTADWQNQSTHYEYTSINPITSINFEYSINAVAGYYETGIGFNILTPAAAQTISIIIPPQCQTTNAGANVTFTVAVVGVSPLHYQWRFNNQELPGATNATLTLNAVGAGNAGSYSVVVWNAYGSATSASASLAVLTDGANGNIPVQIANPTIPPKTSGKDSLIVIVHGWEPLQPLADLSWVTTLSSAIAVKMPGNWVVTNYTWLGLAFYPDPEWVLNFAAHKGGLYGKQLASQGWSRIHFIGHSAGSAFVESAAKAVQDNSSGTIIHSTFLDPFFGLLHEWRPAYGSHSAWSDCYFAEDFAGGYTSGGLPNAYNVDVSWVDPHRQIVPYGTGVAAFSSHGYPHDFYQASVTNTDANWCGTNYGFALSAEKQGVGWNNNPVNYPASNQPLMLCALPDAAQNPNAGLVAAFAPASFILNAYMGAVIFLGNSAASLISASGQLFQPIVASNGVHPNGGSVSYTNTPAWLAVGVTVTNAVNLVQFDAGFNDTNSAEGLLTVYWNTNQIGFADERAVSTNSQTYHFMLPATVANGVYTLSFRLDSFNGTSSSVVVTNVVTGFIGVTEPITLGISLTNGRPWLQLTAPTNYNYLVQSSTNLVDWTPTALLVNTNGTMQFIDSANTNSPARFYRALML